MSVFFHLKITLIQQRLSSVVDNVVVIALQDVGSGLQVLKTNRNLVMSTAMRETSADRF